MIVKECDYCSNLSKGRQRQVRKSKKNPSHYPNRDVTSKKQEQEQQKQNKTKPKKTKTHTTFRHFLN